jgi:hypothetical protein
VVVLPASMWAIIPIFLSLLMDMKSSVPSSGFQVPGIRFAQVPSFKFQVPSEPQDWIIYIKTVNSVQGKRIGITVEVEVEVEAEIMLVSLIYAYTYTYTWFYLSLCTLHFTLYTAFIDYPSLSHNLK